MELFESILLMLGAVFVSNVISRFLPAISIPIIQVALGVILVIFIPQFEMEISSELFLLLFMAPLLFHDGKSSDKKSLWQYRKPILLLAIGLVFLTVFILGYFIHYLLPIVPLAAALAPTDAVAVGSLAEKVKIPSKTMHILEGESLINDASGLVSFQFAVLALVTGAFSPANAGASFILLSLGGALLGVVMSVIFIIIMRLLRLLGIENIISFMLIDILMPFLIFMVAEKVGVNGILAVVGGGIIQSLGFQKMNPESAKLNTISRNTWSVILFSLNGLVFVLLGTQLPAIMVSVFTHEAISPLLLIFYPIVVTLILLSLRFIWVYLFGAFQDSKLPFKKRLQAALLYTIAGFRGTITLVSALSLPFLLAGNIPFTARDLFIFIAAGVIILTLVLANFCLPLLAGKKQENQDEKQMEIEILRDVVDKLKANKDDFNDAAVDIITHTYTERIRALKANGRKNEEERKVHIQVYKWGIENAKNQLAAENISPSTAAFVMRRLNRKLYLLTKERKYRNQEFRDLVQVPIRQHINFKQRRIERAFIMESTTAYIIPRLEKLPQNDDNKEVIEFYLMRYRDNRMKKDFDRTTIKAETNAVSEYAIQLERDLIQRYFENGKISRSELKKCRENLLIMETDLLNE